MAKSTSKTAAGGVKLGSRVKDRITGFVGIAIGRTEFGYGCVHIQIQAQELTKDGDPIPVQTFDDQRVDVLAPPAKAWPEPKKSELKLGSLVRDTLTGASGIATGRTISLDGGVRIMIEQAGVTGLGEPKSPLIVTAERVEVVDRRGLVIGKTSVAASGGPMARGRCLA